MKLFFVFFLFLFSVPVFSQTDAASTVGDAKIEAVSSLRKERAEKVKADILKEIQTFSRKDQAYFYVQLGEALWRHDPKEGIFWLAKGVELGTDSATAYKDDKEKLSSLWNLLSDVLEEDADLTNKLIAKIKEIKIDESKPKILEDANETYILIASQILSRKKDEKLAFDFAMLSLKGEKPAVNWNSAELFRMLKFKHENLADAYFAKIIEAVKNNKDSASARESLIQIDSYFFASANRQELSDAQKKEFLELVFSFVRREAEKLSRKKETDCYLTRSWGIRFQEDYKRLLPEKLPVIEQAIDVCRNSPLVPAWKKPGFLKKPLKTSQDYLDFAKQIDDKKWQALYVKLASIVARGEKNYRLANELADNIDKEFRQPDWAFLKIEALSKLFEELFRKDDFAEIKRILDVEPEFRPFIIVGGLNYIWWQVKPHQKNFLLELMNQARADFNKIDRFANPKDYATNPTKFGQLTQFYVKFGFYEEAVVSHEESIKNLNRIVATLPAEYKDRDRIPLVTSYSRFDSTFPRDNVEFTDKFFDRIYENTVMIENARERLQQRLALLEKNLEKVRDYKSIPGIPSVIVPYNPRKTN